DRAGCAQPALIAGPPAAQVFTTVPGAAPFVVTARRVESRQHGGLVDLKYKEMGEPVGELDLVGRAAADVADPRPRGTDQLIEAGRIPRPAVLLNPRQVRG